MNCPKCGEKRIKWSNRPWNAADEKFWQDGTLVTFICYGKYKVVNGTLEELSPCKAEKK